MNRARLLLAAGLLCGLALPAAQQPTSAPRQTAPPAKKAKKVWTNEDLEVLRDKVPLSDLGPSSAAASDQAQPAPPTGGMDERSLALEKAKKQIQALRDELAAVEQQIRSLRNASSSGRTTGEGLNLTSAPGGLTTQNQIEQLEAKRKDLQRQIAEAEENARRQGFAPGAIR
jgi:hypothetical protein